MGFPEPLSTAVSVWNAFSGQCNKWQNQLIIDTSGQIEKSRGNAGWGFMEIEYICASLWFVTLGHSPASPLSAKRKLTLPATFPSGGVHSSWGYFDFELLAVDCLFLVFSIRNNKTLKKKTKSSQTFKSLLRQESCLMGNYQP